MYWSESRVLEGEEGGSMRLTKPASVFVQLLGAVFIITGFNPPINYILILLGIGLVISGGKAIRKRLDKG